MHVLQEPVVAIRHDLDVLVGQVIGDREHLVMRVTKNDVAVVLPGGAGGFCRRQDPEQALDFGHGLGREPSRVRDEAGRRVVAVLGLTEKVGGAEFGVHGFVGDDHCLGRTGEEIDADTAE